MSAPSRKELAGAVLALSQKLSNSQVSDKLAAYLVHNRRTSELDAIMREVMRQRKNNQGVTEADVTSAYTINAATKRTITELLNSKDLIINEVIDKRMLGGVRVETSEVQLDLTVRNRLNRLKTSVT